MSAHHCHALGCSTPCPPRMLMCGRCWRRVPREIQVEVYRTVDLRGPSADASWAPWWRAQARAIAHVAFVSSPDEMLMSEATRRRDAYLARELAFADGLADEPEGA